MVAVLSTLSNVVTFLLVFGVLGERLAHHQWAGVIVILVGVVLLAKRLLSTADLAIWKLMSLAALRRR